MHSAYSHVAEGKKEAFLMNRIGPSTVDVYIANADGSDERKLLGSSRFPKTADISHLRVSATATVMQISGMSRQTASAARGWKSLLGRHQWRTAVLSPDGQYMTYVSTAQGYKSNIWVRDLRTGAAHDLTNSLAVRGNPALPDGYFRPA